MKHCVLLACVLALTSFEAHSADLAPLRWGGDKNGGAPFIFEEDGQLVGFEVELAEYFGRELGRTPVFVQNTWDNLPLQLVERPADLHLVMNGFEYSKERHAETPTTLPYCIYSFRLIGRVDDDSVASWSELGKAKPKKKVGVLRGTASQKYLETRYGDAIEIVPSEMVTEMLQQVVDGRIDATVQDSPAADYYVGEGRFPKLRIADEPMAPGYYVILTRHADSELRDKLNEAIRKAIRTGELRKLYKKYGLWNRTQYELSYWADQPWPEEGDAGVERRESGGPLRFTVMLSNLIDAAGMTILLAVASFPIAMMIGLFVALGRVYGPRLLRVPLAIYVEVLRGTPLILQLFFLFYLLPELGRMTGSETIREWLTLPKYFTAILGLALNYSAAEAENYRAGLLAVPRGQLEAAQSLGLSWRSSIRHVVLPQAFRTVIPPVTNDFIALFKDTAICSSIMIVELTGLYYQYKTDPRVTVELALSVAVLYLLMSYPLSLLAQYFERRFATAEDHRS